MTPLPHCEHIGTHTIRGIEFAVAQGEGILIGHCYAREQASGQGYILIEQGHTMAELEENWVALVDETCAYAREHDGIPFPNLIGEGWDTDNPPPGRLP